jgi:hypothetical protein
MHRPMSVHHGPDPVLKCPMKTKNLAMSTYYPLDVNTL